jgi:hypothetical protein
MPFIVQFRLGADDWDSPIPYEDCDEMIDVLMQLLADWVAGEADLHGTFGFLNNHGKDFGISDEDVDEGTEPELLQAAADAVLELCVDNEAITEAYLIAIGDRVLITELPDVEEEEQAESQE